MDSSGERGERKCSSIKRTDIEAQCHEGSEVKDGVPKLVQDFSQNMPPMSMMSSVTLPSTAHYSNASSSHSPKRENQQFVRVVRPTIKAGNEIPVPSMEQGHKNVSHKNDKPISSQTVSSRYSSKVTKMATSHQPMSFVNFNSDYEVPLDDPDYLSLFNKYDRFDRVNVSHHLLRPSTEHSGDKISQKATGGTVSVKQKLKSLSKNRTQSLRDSDTMKRLNPQGQILSVSHLLSSTVGLHDDSALYQKNHVDFKTVPNQSSRILKVQGTDLTLEAPHKHIFSQPLTVGDFHKQESEISSTSFATYKSNSNKREHISHQGTALLPGRLHKTTSQPNVASAPHLRKQKSVDDLDSLKLSFEHRFEPENVKTKVKSVLNNIRFGWTFKSKSSFRYDSPLFMLGKCYHRRKDDPSTEPEDQFLRDFASRIWLTYRSNFYPIPGTKLTTDCGWGCMLRSGQMLIAQCLVTHFLGRDWQLYNKQSNADSAFYKEIIRWFSDPVDTPSDKTPFCLHHLTNFGRAHNKDPGEWYGPSSVAYIFRDAFIKASQFIPVLSQLCLYVAQDCTVYIDDVINLCTKRDESGSLSHSSEFDAGASATSAQKVQPEKWQRSLIILIPMRLGGEVMNTIYTPCVQSLLSHNTCMGIIGGRPKHSLYFIGWQDSKLIYLDPHLCREAIDTTVSDFKIESFHCMTPRKLAFSKMDPSCTVGFYIRDEDDFNKFVQEVQELISPPKQKGIYPLFVFSDGHRYEMEASQSYSSPDRRVRVTHYRVDENGKRTCSGESEEFVVL